MRFPDLNIDTSTLESVHRSVTSWASALTGSLKTFHDYILKRTVTINSTGGIDVAGRIKVADDGSTPQNGQIRYNSSTNKFQGYAAGAWVDLH